MITIQCLTGKDRTSIAFPVWRALPLGALCLWLAVVFVAHAQQENPTLFEAIKTGQVTAEIFGKSTSFDQPILVVQATNARAEPITLSVPMGTILRSREPTYCDVVVLTVEPPLVLADRSEQPVLAAIYGYCLQPAPGERRYPPPQATYDATDEVASRSVLRVLAAVPADEQARRDLAVQIAVWIAQGITQRETLQNRSGYADLSPYWERANAYVQGVPSPPTVPSGGFTPWATVRATVPGAAVGPSATSAVPSQPSQSTTRASALLPSLLCLGGLLALLIPLAILLVRGRQQKAPRDEIPPEKVLGSDEGVPPGPERPIRPRLVTVGPSPSRTGTEPLGRTGTPPPAEGATAEAQPSVSPSVVSETSPLPRAQARPDHSKTFEKAMRAVLEPPFVELIIEDGTPDKKVLQVPVGRSLISLHEAEFLTFGDPRVSTPHLVIRVKGDGTTTIRDLGSEEGTVLYSREASASGRSLPIGPNAAQELNNGDRIQVGSTILVYQAAGPMLTSADGRKHYMLSGRPLWIISREKLPFVGGMEHIRQTDNRISSPHALIEVGHNIRIRDLNSLNGTTVQGRPLLPGQWAALRDGWTLQIGTTRLTVHTNIAGLPDLIAGRYEVRRWISAGGMADIFAVRDLDDGVERALKVIRARFLSQNERLRQLYLDAFRMEAARSKAIMHPGFVRVHAVGEDPTAGPYLVMDLINGPSVDELVGHHKCLPVADAAEIACQAAEALRHLHQQHHLVHCDVAPKNLLVEPNGLVYVLDLGIAMQEGERQPDFASDGYIAPELLRGEPATPAADVYSLSVTLYEMITGERYQPTREGQAGEELIRQALLARAPQELTEAVLRGLQNDPGQRYASMDHFLADLSLHRRGADLPKLLAWWVQPGPAIPAAPTGLPAAQPAAVASAAPSQAAPGPQQPPSAASARPTAVSPAEGPAIALQVSMELKTCPKCGHPVRTGARFCSSCGIMISISCPNCGAANRPQARFCAGCGHPLRPDTGHA
ncbi:MAG: protein kinase [Candidatus Hadarchaeum sp.]